MLVSLIFSDWNWSELYRKPAARYQSTSPCTDLFHSDIYFI
jgi:hypothetical protein